jgi:Leucine-rich repeat (LRR) protein
MIILVLTICAGFVPLNAAAPQLPPNLTNLTLRFKAGLSNVDALRHAPNLESIEISDSSDILHLQNFPAMKKARSLKIDGMDQLSSLDWLKGFTALDYLDLSRNKTLVSLEGIPPLTVRTVTCTGNENLTSVAGISNLTSLAHLDLHGNFLLCDLSAISGLASLETLDLSYSPNLRDLSPLTNLPNLKRLDLTGCGAITNYGALSQVRSLEMLDLSFVYAALDLQLPAMPAVTSVNMANSGFLSVRFQGLCPKLTMVDLGHNKSLKALAGFDQLPALSSVCISGCVLITNLSFLNGTAAMTNANLSRLEVLQSLAGLPDWPLLKELNVSYNPVMTNVAELGKFKSLNTLDLSENPALLDISPVTNLSSLKHLNVSFTASITNVDWLKHLTLLETVNLNGLLGLTSLAGFPEMARLNVLRVSAGGLRTVDGLPPLPLLREVELDKCRYLTNVQALARLPALGTLRVQHPFWPDFTEIPPLRVKTLDSSFGDNLRSLKGLEHWTNLAYLDLSFSPTLENLAEVRQLSELRVLRLTGSGAITDLDVLAGHRSLEIVDASRMPKLRSIAGLRNLPALGRLNAAQNPELTEANISDLPSLRSVDLSMNRSLELATIGPSLPKLARIYVSRNHILREVVFAETLPELAELEISWCPRLERIKRIGAQEKLAVLHMDGAQNLKWISGSQNLPPVKTLYLRHCGLSDLTGLDRFSALKSLSFGWSMELKSLAGLTSLVHIEEIDMRGCPDLKDHEDLAKLTHLRSILRGVPARD